MSGSVNRVHYDQLSPLPSKVIAHGMPELKEVQSMYFFLHLNTLKSPGALQIANSDKDKELTFIRPDSPAQARAFLKDTRDLLSTLANVPGGNWPLRATYGNQMTAFLRTVGTLKEQMEEMMRNASVED